jgi:hypothetical protein
MPRANDVSAIGFARQQRLWDGPPLFPGIGYDVGA